VSAGSDAFTVTATFPRLRGEPAGTTTPEELLAGSHATCFGIGLRSVLAQRGVSVSRVRVTATITAEKGDGRIRVVSAHLAASVEGATGVDVGALEEAAHEAERACTISTLLRPTVPVSLEVRSGASSNSSAV